LGSDYVPHHIGWPGRYFLPFQETDKATLELLFVSGAGIMLFVRNLLTAVAAHNSSKATTGTILENPTKITVKDLFN
jgi:hypothetical protein